VGFGQSVGTPGVVHPTALCHGPLAARDAEGGQEDSWQISRSHGSP
jgi:hypothetical protein